MYKPELHLLTSFVFYYMITKSKPKDLKTTSIPTFVTQNGQWPLGGGGGGGGEQWLFSLDEVGFLF